MAAWVIPAITTGVSLYNALNKPSNPAMEEYVNMLKKRQQQGIGGRERQRLYGEGSRQIGATYGGFRQQAGARSSAMGVGRSSTASSAIGRLNTQQAGALSGLRSNITAYDQQTKDNAMAALGQALQAQQQSQLYQQGAAGQALGQSLTGLQNTLYPPPNPYLQAQQGGGWK